MKTLEKHKKKNEKNAEFSSQWPCRPLSPRLECLLEPSDPRPPMRLYKRPPVRLIHVPWKLLAPGVGKVFLSTATTACFQCFFACKIDFLPETCCFHCFLLAKMDFYGKMLGFLLFFYRLKRGTSPLGS